MVRRVTARGDSLDEVTVCANVSGLLVEICSPGSWWWCARAGPDKSRGYV